MRLLTLPALCITVLFSISVMAQKNEFHILPSSTEKSMDDIHGPHLVYTPEKTIKRNKLIIALPGTGSRADALKAFDSVAMREGFHVIGLDYNNAIVTTACRASLDSMCFDSFRQEISFGTPVSDTVRVDSTNSIYNRIYQLLRYLTVQQSKDGWENYFKNNQIIWSNIILAGHSQGAGHAAYFGKHFLLNKVIILAGPQDYLDQFKRPAPWINLPSKTPVERYIALLHSNDPFSFERQFASCLKLSNTQAKDSLNTESRLIPKRNILVTHLENKDPHGSVTKLSYSDTWKYMFDR